MEGKMARLDFGGTEAVRGRLLGKSGPMTNRRVQLSVGAPDFGPVVVSSSTDAEGRFVFFGPPVGRYTLRYEIEGIRGDYSSAREVEVTGKAMDLGDLNVVAGDVIVEVNADDPADAQRIRYLAVVTDLLGRTGQDQVREANREGAQWRAASVPAGAYRITVYMAGEWPWRMELPFTRNADGSPATVKLHIPRRSATLRATVLAGSDATNPLTQVAHIANEDRTIMTSLHAGDKTPGTLCLPPGTYYVMDLLTAKPRTDIAPIVLQAGQTTQVQINLAFSQSRQMVPVGLHPWSADGVPVYDGILPRLLRADGSAVEMIRNQEGVAIFAVPPGRYRATRDLPGQEPANQEIDVAPSPAKLGMDVDLILPQ
jgi:hypothetical protein